MTGLEPNLKMVIPWFRYLHQLKNVTQHYINCRGCTFYTSCDETFAVKSVPRNPSSVCCVSIFSLQSSSGQCNQMMEYTSGQRQLSTYIYIHKYIKKMTLQNGQQLASISVFCILPFSCFHFFSPFRDIPVFLILVSIHYFIRKWIGEHLIGGGQEHCRLIRTC